MPKNALHLVFYMLCCMSLTTHAQILVWEENFNAPTINSATWKYDNGDGCDKGICGWGNSELEYYTNRPENARIESGNLVIEARREVYAGKQFTSARLKTDGLVQFKYGTVEARIKIPNVTNGLWPAFWTLGTVGGVWPAIGEIDMMEIGSSAALQAGVANKRVSSAAHWSQAGVHQYNLFYKDAAVNLSDDYHLYKMVWTKEAIKMYLDGVEYYNFDISGGAAADLSEFHNPHYLLLNLAVGGTYTGIATDAAVTAPFPGKMYVDYIKLTQNPGDELFVASNNPTPVTAAPTPTKAKTDVISLFSDAYTNVPVGTWSADWDKADVASVKILGNDTKLYTNLEYAGIEFSSTLIDATDQTHLHLDIWTPNSTTFKVKLVDFGANGIYQGAPNDDKEHELTYTPAIGSWVSYDIKLSDFTGLTTRAHLAQMIISGSKSTMYMDNVYFYKTVPVTIPTAPIAAAPTPTRAKTDVISMFSNAYTNVPVGTWSADWDVADVAQVQIAGNDTKLYTNLVYAGIDFSGNLIDATAQTHLHLDIWTPNSSFFKVKLVDFGANGIYQGSPNDDREHELSFAPALGEWVSYDIPLTNFTSLTARAHLAQMIISGSNSKVYVDNVYFYKNTISAAPTTNLPIGIAITNTLVHDVLNITADGQLPITINIVNISGEQVYSGKVQGSQQLNLGHLTAGLYIIHTSKGGAIRFVKD
jgi:beta-glucanase (GH16 family)